MATLNATELEAKLDYLARFTEEELMRIRVRGEGGLRDLTAGILPIEIQRVKKKDLVEAIMEATAERRRLVAPEEKKALRRNVKDVAESVAKYLETLEGRSLEETMGVAEGHAMETYNIEARAYAPITMSWRWSMIRKELMFNESRLVSAFCYKYDELIRKDRMALRTEARRRLEARHETAFKIDGNLLEWANEVIENPMGKDWQAVSCAVAIVTGRRISEVHCTATFEAVDNRTLRFSGQLKTKDPDKMSYLIPCLADADKIVEAMRFLRRYNTPKDVDNRISSIMSAWVKRNIGQNVKYHDFRRLYAAEAYRLYGATQDKSVDAYYRDILGHSDINAGQAYRA